MNSFTYFVLMLAGMLGYAGLIYRVLSRGDRGRATPPAHAIQANAAQRRGVLQSLE